LVPCAREVKGDSSAAASKIAPKEILEFVRSELIGFSPVGSYPGFPFSFPTDQ
jgi:hypothetical protein